MGGGGCFACCGGANVDRAKVSRGLVKREALRLFCCSPTIANMTTTNKPKKLTRAQLRESLDTVPVSHILGSEVSRELTPKQRAFALEVAKGSTGASAYRKAYNAKGKPKTVGDHASRLKGDDRIKAEIEAMQLAIRAQEYQTPAALRALVIQSLVGVITNPESNAGQITAAAKVLGTVTEVAAFTERREVKTITSSETARAQVLEQLRTLVHGSAVDVTPIDRDADSLMAELSEGFDGTEEAGPHPPATPHFDDAESPDCMHTIPHEQSAFPHGQPHSAATTTGNTPPSFLK